MIPGATGGRGYVIPGGRGYMIPGVTGGRG